MKNSISRFIIISLVLMCLMGALIYKLHEVTIVEGAQYAEAAANTSTSSIDIKGTRGRILDRNGVVLAYSKTAIMWSSFGMRTTVPITTPPHIPIP